MGYVSTREIRTFLGEDQAVRWHLQSNFYPPITLSFLPAVRRALALARAECWETKIELPSGYEKTVREICCDLHLEAFLDIQERA